jgi:hypothetical protein
MGVKIGFKFVPLPVDIWDDSIDLSLAEFRLLGYLIRRQIRFGKAGSPLSYDELMSGPWREGKRLDAGCGLSRNSLKQAITLLQQRGWIKVTDLSQNPRLPRLVVEVLVSDDDLSSSDNQSSKSDDAPLSTSDDGLSLNDDEKPISSSKSDDLYKRVEVKSKGSEEEMLLPVVVVLPCVGGKTHSVTQSEIDHWQEFFPAIDVMQCLRNMVIWLESNPTKKKTPRGVPKFITGWLSREQDRGGSRSAIPPPKPKKIWVTGDPRNPEDWKRAQVRGEDGL